LPLKSELFTADFVLFHNNIKHYFQQKTIIRHFVFSDRQDDSPVKDSLHLTQSEYLF